MKVSQRSLFPPLTPSSPGDKHIFKKRSDLHGRNGKNRPCSEVEDGLCFQSLGEENHPVPGPSAGRQVPCLPRRWGAVRKDGLSGSPVLGFQGQQQHLPESAGVWLFVGGAAARRPPCRRHRCSPGCPPRPFACSLACLMLGGAQLKSWEWTCRVSPSHSRDC